MISYGERAAAITRYSSVNSMPLVCSVNTFSLYLSVVLVCRLRPFSVTTTCTVWISTGAAKTLQSAVEYVLELCVIAVGVLFLQLDISCQPPKAPIWVRLWASCSHTFASVATYYNCVPEYKLGINRHTVQLASWSCSFSWCLGGPQNRRSAPPQEGLFLWRSVSTRIYKFG